MAKKILLLLCVVFAVSFSNVQAESPSNLLQLDEISDEALQLTKLKRYEDTEKMLSYFSDQFLKATAKEQIFSMDELRIITVAHNQALQAVKNNQASSAEKVNSVTKFRLVIDAINSTHQPLWTAMEDQLMVTFSQTKAAVKKQDPEEFHVQLNTLLSQYDMIYPSLKVDLAPDRIQKLDERLQFINQNSTQVFSEKGSQKELDALQQDFKSIFDEMNEDEADPSLWWVIISTGSIIILTLSYVGWRKYKGGKEKSIKERND
ncbi:sporulation protein YpjB [Peribacillus cavernae]|uniref:Sporulation protein YpjB n=1 Tax=Peribacillus cavernae TaxID=1674310 RepID=A0A3S0U1T4_9BACI|nr:sporulation protein YpjB [Peribacillus cavernae]MDQ0218973.1 sporulation protein YpjB [Peribacillus cavernae]RUQ29320.1 sporulation protein YpjB [Peribacillus cavernae]